MDVTIYYTDAYQPAPSGIERLSTPLESGYDRRRVCFRELESEAAAWCLAVEHWCKPQGEGWGWRCEQGGIMLKKRCGSMADYMEWLTRNVSIIEVDGRPFWVNPGIEGGEQ